MQGYNMRMIILILYLGDRPEDQKKWIQNNTQIPSFDINSFSMENRKDKLPSAAVEFNLTLNRFATVSGKRIFVTPNFDEPINVCSGKNYRKKNERCAKNGLYRY
jgi:hypothetical protein